MPTNETILRLNQAGLETTRGTGVAATRKLYATIAPSYDRPITEFSDTSGTFEDLRRVAYQRPNIGFAATDLMTYEDTAWWFQSLIKGGVVGVTDAGTPPAYTYGFTPSLATDDLKTFTLEFNESGNPYKSTQVLNTDWTIRIDPDNEGGWLLDANFIARDWNTATYTGSITDRTTEVIKAPGTLLYIDSATIGTTQVTGKFISATVTGDNAPHLKAFAEDELSWPANKVGRGRRRFTAQFVLEFDSDTEFANYRATTPVERYIRIERSGTQIHGSTATNKRIRLDMNGYWRSISWGDRQGNIIATFGFQPFYDATSGYALKAEVVNALVTLP